jgi:glutaconate CoA-transferase, subunit B
VITDFGILRPHPETEELQLTAVYPGVSAEAARQGTGWPLKVAPVLEELPPPRPEDLEVLRQMQRDTEQAHSAQIRIRVKLP